MTSNISKDKVNFDFIVHDPFMGVKLKCQIYLNTGNVVFNNNNVNYMRIMLIMLYLRIGWSSLKNKLFLKKKAI